ncbi:putative nucleic acid-binding protein [Peteryoungia aggregata LMG 23059]|uniref:Nucleic acid-binding protein n=1 Tax=Peteryoungia aggregata LMG 23059 TaxID=1368425 RepID=A0ABU0G4R7_9HYPH|nr:PIN domain-containing protein [Peteryoungia aggregata]MDQ0420333.1 putative nucleic acid-binding protein [Peteryoungia aggregata LMG 23059]
MIAVKRVYLDTNVFIMLSEKSHQLQRLLTNAIAAQPMGSPPVFATSELTLSELLVKPHQMGDDTLIEGYESLIQSSDLLDVRPVDHGVLYYAAVIRAQYGHLKLPDAIHVSSALGQGCSHFLTDDQGIKDRYDLVHTRYGSLAGSASLTILRPDEPTLTSLIESLSA